MKVVEQIFLSRGCSCCGVLSSVRAVLTLLNQERLYYEEEIKNESPEVAEAVYENSAESAQDEFSQSHARRDTYVVPEGE